MGDRLKRRYSIVDLRLWDLIFTLSVPLELFGETELYRYFYDAASVIKTNAGFCLQFDVFRVLLDIIVLKLI